MLRLALALVLALALASPARLDFRAYVEITIAVVATPMDTQFLLTVEVSLDEEEALILLVNWAAVVLVGLPVVN